MHHVRKSLQAQEPNQKCFITSITSNYNNPGTFKKIPGWDYILFTDLSSNISKTSWNVKKLNFKEKNPIINSRCMKFQAWKFLKKYRIIIWCDGYLRPITNKQFWDKIVKQTISSKNGIVQSKHPIRSCPYKECAAVLKEGKDTAHSIRRTTKLLKKKNIKQNSGLWENCCFCYDTRNKNAQKLFNTLWDIYKTGTYSKRDQIMYMYAIHITKIIPEMADEFLCKNREGGKQGFLRRHFIVTAPHGRERRATTS